ncbi:response regulator [Microbacterium oleivorans]|uniref:Response regulator receiver n=1 Tax=Microbacterium oleivorans TaxID=273677 RepID=A0A031FR73_9MICO|nr:response regulator [Microbacterium oleivorans]EZP26797.1 Response regulator receiver [Microbacterium oleivorans]
MGISVLVVDDDDDIAMLLVSSLERAGIATARAGNGREGIERVRADRPRVVLMDWMMPVTDGIQAAQEIREDAEIAQPHIIMLTARVHITDQEQALRAGVDEVLAKPFRPREIVGHVKELLELAS